MIAQDYRESAETASIYAALGAAQAEGLIAIEGRKNPMTNSTYADLVAVWQMVRPHLTRHGLVISQLVGAVRAEGAEHVIGLRTTLAHAPSGQYISATGEFMISVIATKGGGMMSKTWASASAITYLRRYAMLCILGIITGDDDDAQATAQQILGVEPVAGTKAEGKPVPIKGDFAQWVDKKWKEAAGPDGRPLGQYGHDELRDLVRKTADGIDTGGNPEVLKAVVWDSIQTMLHRLKEPLDTALIDRGWNLFVVPGEWTLHEFRLAANLLLNPNPKAEGADK